MCQLAAREKAKMCLFSHHLLKMLKSRFQLPFGVHITQMLVKIYITHSFAIKKCRKVIHQSFPIDQVCLTFEQGTSTVLNEWNFFRTVFCTAAQKAVCKLKS